MNEIQRPAGIDLGFDQDRRPDADGAPPSTALAHGQALLAIEAVDPIDAGCLAFLAQQDEQAPIAEAATFIGQVPQPSP